MCTLRHIPDPKPKDVNTERANDVVRHQWTSGHIARSRNVRHLLRHLAKRGEPEYAGFLSRYESSKDGKPPAEWMFLDAGPGEVIGTTFGGIHRVVGFHSLPAEWSSFLGWYEEYSTLSWAQLRLAGDRFPERH